MRTLSQAIKDVLAAEYGETRDVVIITIPAQYGAVNYPETTLYLANGEGVVVDGKTYENKLRAISSIKFSLGKAPDNADLTLENVSRELGFTLTDFQRMLDGSKVVIKRAFKVPSGWESNTLFVGYIRDVRVSFDVININVTSDMSRRGTSVAGRTITQRCIFRFNTNGSGIGPLCGWVTSQPGNALSCDKGLDTPNGCQSHGNQHRFGGVPAFTVVNTGNGYDTGSGGDTTWGSGPGGGWCISVDSWVLTERGGKKVWIRAYDLHDGDYLISIDKFGRFVPTKVHKVTPANTSKLYTISTVLGYSLSCSPTHRVMQHYSREDGVAVNTLKEGDEVLCYDFKEHSHLIDTIESIETIKRSSIVLQLELDDHHLFMAGRETLGAIVSHNLKPIFTDFNDYPMDRYYAFDQKMI